MAYNPGISVEIEVMEMAVKGDRLWGTEALH
jgi:hypothetical protein